MTKEKFKKLAEKHLFILEGYSLDKDGNKEMQIYGFDALYKQLLLHNVVGQSEQLFCFCDNPTEYTDANNHTYCKWCGKDFKAK